MIVLGVTGAMGAGKSTTTALLAAKGFPVFDCDAVVHELMQKNAFLIKKIGKSFPDCFSNGKINRKKLSDAVSDDVFAIEKLEKTVFPFLIRKRNAFLKKNAACPLVVIDAPTLFENGWDKICDKVLSVTAPPDVLRGRVMRRKGMTAEKYAFLKSRQINEDERLKRSDYVIPSFSGEKDVGERLEKILRELLT